VNGHICAALEVKVLPALTGRVEDQAIQGQVGAVEETKNTTDAETVRMHYSPTACAW
jgi:hypothetical protein